MASHPRFREAAILVRILDTAEAVVGEAWR